MLCVSQKYIAVGEFGKATDTLDATGSVTLEKGFGKSIHLIFQIPRHSRIICFCKLLFLLYRLSLSELCLHIFSSPEHITRLDVEEKLKAFTGDIMQVPPL